MQMPRGSLRRSATALLVLAALLLGRLAVGQSLALTFDDGPDMTDAVGLGPSARNESILRQLAAARLKSILFATRVDGDPQRNELLRQWGLQGHGLGNHTAT